MVEKLNDATIVRIRTGELHAHQLEKVKSRLFELLDQEMPSKLILDLKEVQYAYSDLLELLLQLHKRMQSAGGELVAIKVSPIVREIIAATKLDQVLHLDSDGD